jgi:hypothetical protein
MSIELWSGGDGTRQLVPAKANATTKTSLLMLLRAPAV